MLKQFGHMERSEESMTKRVYMSQVEGTRKSGKPRRSWKEAELPTMSNKKRNTDGKNKEFLSKNLQPCTV